MKEDGIMSFLRGLAASLLSFLLFLSLAAFGLVFMLNETILNPDFLVSQVSKLDMPALAEELIGEQVPIEGEQGEYLAAVISDTIADLEPWIEEQTGVLTRSTINYLKGESQSLSVVIPLEPVKESLEDNLRETIMASPPPELAGLPPAQVEQFIDEICQQMTQSLPATFEFTEDSFPADAQPVIEQIRQAIGYLETAYWGLIGFMVLLVLGIILIKRNVRSTTRGLGITFLIYGALEYAGIYAANFFLGPQMMSTGLPASLQSYLPQLVADFMSPLQIFSIGLMAAGVVLIVVSFVWRREPSF